MVEFKPEMMSEDDLLEAANKIFNAQEQDFEKIKSEKWYQTLFHAITLNRDGQKYAVRGMSSLAKLQQLFMNIYVKNYKETNEQLNIIIDAIIQDKNAIKELYMRILGPEKREDLKDLEPMDAELLVLLLSEYKDENGNAPGRIGEYNAGVRTALRKNGLIGSYKVTLDKLDELKAPEVVYRCFMEQCAIDGTIESQDWPDNINPYLDELVLSTRDKNEIRSEVKHEFQTTTVDYFLNKYTCEYDTNEMFKDEDFEIELDEAEAFTYGEDLGDREDEYIDSILQISVDTVKRYVNKNIHISAYINCAGTLEFDNCYIFYNESGKTDEITMNGNAKISIVNSVVICAGLDKTPFISGGNSSIDVSLETSKFVDCSYFIDACCNSFRMTGCYVENCFCNFLCVREAQICEIRDNMIVHSDLADFNFQDEYSMKEIDIQTNDNAQGYFNNNVFIENDRFKAICKRNIEKGICYLSFRSELPVSNCTFEGISQSIMVYNVRNCRFEKCSNGVRVLSASGSSNKNAIIENCVFNECTEAVSANNNTKILYCQFISCYDSIITGYWRGGTVIEYCEFINTRYKTSEDEKTAYGVNIDMMYSIFRKSSILMKGGKDDGINYIRKCIFNGADLENAYLICADLRDKPSTNAVYVEECSFTCCTTKRKDEEVIKIEGSYFPKFSRKRRNVKTIQVNNCKGLDRVNKEGSNTEDIKAKMTDDSGNLIGASLQL